MAFASLISLLFTLVTISSQLEDASPAFVYQSCSSAGSSCPSSSVHSVNGVMAPEACQIACSHQQSVMLISDSVLYFSWPSPRFSFTL